MLAAPPALLEVLRISGGHQGGYRGSTGPPDRGAENRTSCSLDELLARCDETAPPDDRDRCWLDAKPAGNELL